MVVVHAFNPITWEAEAGGILRVRAAWSTEEKFQGRETLSRKTKNKTKQKITLSLSSEDIRSPYRWL